MILVKYNPARKNKYQLITKIQKNRLTGKKQIIKSPQSPEALKHLKTIIVNEKKLDLLFGDKLVVSQSTLKGNSLISDFIPGITLADKIQILVKEKLYSQVETEIDKIMSILESVSKDGFITPAPIDFILENIIENKTGLYLIDSEWLRTGKTELGYIQYRLLLNLSKHLNKFLGKENVFFEFTSLGYKNYFLPKKWVLKYLSPEKIAQYSKKEYLFQKKVQRNQPIKSDNETQDSPLIVKKTNTSLVQKICTLFQKLIQNAHHK